MRLSRDDEDVDVEMDVVDEGEVVEKTGVGDDVLNEESEDKDNVVDVVVVELVLE
jgi:hypothetical protein